MSRPINLHYIDQTSHLRGLHRSGWEYVIKQLEQLHADDGIICDTFVDRTFLFNTDPKLDDMIPYAVPWIGFVHHPFDPVNSATDSSALVDNENFKKSLTTCKGIFVFGESMKEQWEQAVQNLGHPGIVVTSLVHPTESVGEDRQFTMDKFNANREHSIVQIGAHLRDTYAIFALNKGQSPVGSANLHKVALVGPKMDGYYAAETFFNYLTYADNVPADDPQGPGNPVIPEDQRSITSVNAPLPDVLIAAANATPAPDVSNAICRMGSACRNAYTNRYLLGAMNVLKQYDLSVALIPTLDNLTFDKLLSENVVFLQLYESATTAVNTILECIVRNTPIVVNRIPSVVELLGDEYPLFFTKIEEVPGLLSLERIEAAHVYLLETIEKSQFTGQSFISAFTVPVF